jgi:hypothetical protein
MVAENSVKFLNGLSADVLCAEILCREDIPDGGVLGSVTVCPCAAEARAAAIINSLPITIIRKLADIKHSSEIENLKLGYPAGQAVLRHVTVNG